MQEAALNTIVKAHKENTLYGRYIYTKHIEPLLKKHASNFNIEVVGQSVLEENIYAITIGTGEKKVLMWSQMHGNESTTTKAIFDLLNFLSDKTLSESLINGCTLVIIPILNPDGAKAYTRLNANLVDLNRDAQNLSQPESKVLRSVFNKFKPHYCFNLHGQRTIFSAGSTNKPASLSFLAPAQDKACSITTNRKHAMSIIVKMNRMLQKELPNQVGIYDDAFNLNCVGDTFQSLNVPTVLFEAGHIANDYDREVVRHFVFKSYIVALYAILEQSIDLKADVKYLEIPQNEKLFYDVIIKNALYNGKLLDVAIQYQEILKDEKIHFVPKIEKIENLNSFYAHNQLEANGQVVLDQNNNPIIVGNEIDFVMINNAKFSIKFD